MKRQRGRNRNNNRNNNNRNNNPNRSLDSNGPDVKVRGNASTIYEKYTALARDAKTSGNRVKAENLRQHAEHYLRLMNALEAAKLAAQEERDAARAARGEANGEASEGEGETETRKGRRYPPRVKSAQKRDEAEQGKTEENSDADNVAAKSDEDSRADNDAPAEEKPKRRRKAPARKEEAEAAIDAAE